MSWRRRDSTSRLYELPVGVLPGDLVAPELESADPLTADGSLERSRLPGLPANHRRTVERCQQHASRRGGRFVGDHCRSDRTHPIGVMLAWPPHGTMGATTPDGKRMG